MQSLNASQSIPSITKNNSIMSLHILLRKNQVSVMTSIRHRQEIHCIQKFICLSISKKSSGTMKQ